MRAGAVVVAVAADEEVEIALGALRRVRRGHDVAIEDMAEYPRNGAR